MGRSPTITLLLLLSIHTFKLAGQDNSFTISPQVHEQQLGHLIEIFEDLKGNKTIEDILSPEIAGQFVPSNDTEPNFGFTESVYWAKLTVDNRFMNSPSGF